MFSFLLSSQFELVKVEQLTHAAHFAKGTLHRDGVAELALLRVVAGLEEKALVNAVPDVGRVVVAVVQVLALVRAGERVLVVEQVQVDDVVEGHVAHGAHLLRSFIAEELLGWKM